MLIKKHKRTILVSAIIVILLYTVVTVTIPPSTQPDKISLVIKNGTSLSQIARTLKEHGLIRSRLLFMAASLLYGGKLIAGEYELSKDKSLIEIVAMMGRGERKIYALKIVEGYNLYNIADAMEHSHIMKGHDFLTLAQNKEFLKKAGIAADSLEGYLAPDTYHYSKEIDIEQFIEKIIQRTLTFFTQEDIAAKMKELNFDIHKTLTLASMIEKEAKSKDEKPLISAVFHNRLKKGMSLDCDPTVIYGLKRFGSPLTRADLAYYTPYNTYTFVGLPKGPICSPDKHTIRAALNPAQVDYLYFVSKNDGTHVFSKDMQEHNRFVIMYQRARTTKKQ